MDEVRELIQYVRILAEELRAADTFHNTATELRRLALAAEAALPAPDVEALSGNDVEYLFCVALLNVLDARQIAAVLKVYNEDMKPNARAVLAALKPAAQDAPRTERRWRFTIEQDGLTVASGDCPDEATVRNEAIHYGLQYGQDGPCKATVFPEERRVGERREDGDRRFIGSDRRRTAQDGEEAGR